MDNFEQIYRQYGEAVFLFLLSLSHDPALSEELTQETMLRAILNIGTFRGESKLYSWLCQIARNLYYDWQKKSRRTLPIDEAALPDQSADPAAEAAEHDTAERLLQQLHALEEPYKEVFLLHVFGDIPLAQISRLFGKSESWARVTYYRAKARLSAEWKEEEL